MGDTEFNLAAVHETVAAVVPDRPCVVLGERRLTYGAVTDRTRRLAAVLRDHGLGLRAERRHLAPWESGQDHVGLYLHNGPEYLEGMLGAFKARAAPFNVNYRYVDEELRYLLADASARALVYHAAFAPTLARVLPDLPPMALLLQVADDSGHDLLPGAVDYEAALAAAPAEPPPVPPAPGAPSPDDLYVLYTGGTTGMPKGVLWRQHDIFMAAMGGRAYGSWATVADEAELLARVLPEPGVPLLVLPPLMHGAAQWAAFYFMSMGATIVFPDDPTRLDPADAWRTAARERVAAITVVGDAMARPLVEELERRGAAYDTNSVRNVGSGGAILSQGMKQRLLDVLPGIVVSDTGGASETGAQMGAQSTAGAVETGRFAPGPGTVLLDAGLARVLGPDERDVGWLAQRGWVPLGYLGDPGKTERTFPVIDGVRYAVPGDRARWSDDGRVELLGRDAVTINSGGEKIFAEEVEQALLRHPAVADVVVAGRPSDRWGEEVVALVQLAPGASVDAAELTEEASRHVARYKLPKAIGFLDRIERAPSGKADYRWARDQASRV